MSYLMRLNSRPSVLAAILVQVAAYVAAPMAFCCRADLTAAGDECPHHMVAGAHCPMHAAPEPVEAEGAHPGSVWVDCESEETLLAWLHAPSAPPESIVQSDVRFRSEPARLPSNVGSVDPTVLPPSPPPKA